MSRKKPKTKWKTVECNSSLCQPVFILMVFFNVLSLKIKHNNYSPFVKKQPTNWTAVQHSDILLFDPNAKHKISNLFAWYFTILLGTWYGKKDEIYTHPDWTDQMTNSKAGDLLYRTVFRTFIGFRVFQTSVLILAVDISQVRRYKVKMFCSFFHFIHSW